MLQWVIQMALCHLDLHLNYDPLLQKLSTRFSQRIIKFPSRPDKKNATHRIWSHLSQDITLNGSKLKPQACSSAWVKSNLYNLHCIIFPYKKIVGQICEQFQSSDIKFESLFTEPHLFSCHENCCCSLTSLKHLFRVASFPIFTLKNFVSKLTFFSPLFFVSFQLQSHFSANWAQLQQLMLFILCL